MIIKGYSNYNIDKNGIITNIKKNRIVKCQFDKDGYKTLKLYNKGKYKRFKLHRLIGIHFIPQIEGKEFIDHIDRNKLNNNISNLRWVNRSENNSNRSAYKHSKLKERYISIQDEKYYTISIRKHNFFKIYKIKDYDLQDIIKIRDNIINDTNKSTSRL